MSLSASAIRLMAQKGLSASDIADIAEANEPAKSSGAVRQKRYRDNKRNVTRDVTPPLNDIYSKPPEPCEAEASQAPLLEKVVADWNAGPAANGARKATKLDAGRKALLRARIREHGEPQLFEAMANLAASRFHCGENDRGWRVNLGWFLEGKNFLKAVEMGDGPANSAPRQAMTTEAQQAYLATLDSDTKPWMRRSEIAPPAPRKGNTGPPRPIGDLITNIAGADR